MVAALLQTAMDRVLGSVDARRAEDVRRRLQPLHDALMADSITASARTQIASLINGTTRVAVLREQDRNCGLTTVIKSAQLNPCTDPSLFTALDKGDTEGAHARQVQLVLHYGSEVRQGDRE